MAKPAMSAAARGARTGDAASRPTTAPHRCWDRGPEPSPKRGSADERSRTLLLCLRPRRRGRSRLMADPGTTGAAAVAAAETAAGAAALAAPEIDPFVFRLAIFALAIFVGYYVVWSVTPALHTPLMSVTNAVSSVIVVGALLAVGVEAAATAGGGSGQGSRLRRPRPRLGEHLRRLPGHSADAGDVPAPGPHGSAQMTPSLAALAYLVSGILFILTLRGLSSPATSRRGNALGMAGMAIAIATTLSVTGIADLATALLILLGIGIGGSIGAFAARRIAMTAMPQLVAAFPQPRRARGGAGGRGGASTRRRRSASGSRGASAPRASSRCPSASRSAPSPSPARSSPS